MNNNLIRLLHSQIAIGEKVVINNKEYIYSKSGAKQEYTPVSEYVALVCNAPPSRVLQGAQFEALVAGTAK